ncbi:hypothetical protein [Streptomyces sp. NPDC088707]|uniref:hypothetical protein n=1 Tax=Streptomyces sp. NPDC088707 TaxID=3365871 RepID=UPI003819FCCB
MSDHHAACTPNSLPVNGSTPHGYQLTVLDEGLHVNEVAELPDWQKFNGDEADRQLMSMGYVPKGEWTAAGLGHMVPVSRIDEMPV